MPSQSISTIPTSSHLETTINSLKALLERRLHVRVFSDRLEKEYRLARTKRFLEIDLVVVVAGLFFYLAFAYFDLALGGPEMGAYIMYNRIGLSVVLLVGLLALAYSPWRVHIVLVTAVGITIAGMALLYFNTLIPNEMRFAYHMGMIPIQVFIVIALRLSVRSAISVSVVLFSSYCVMIWQVPQHADNPELNRLVDVFIPLFLMFWFALIVMSGYIAFAMESASRREFVQNKLLGLEHKRLTALTEQLHQLSTTDALTGLSNRRLFDESLATEWSRAQRYQHSLAIIMIDVDFFKLYNDHFGHQQGDVCLQQVGKALAENCRRPGDVRARYGGEEFVVLVPQGNSDDARHIAENIRQAVEALQLEHPQSDKGICTISAGVAATDSAAEFTDAMQLLEAADAALYRAKEQGRNCVVVN